MRTSKLIWSLALLLAGCGSIPQLPQLETTRLQAKAVEVPQTENFKKVNEDLYRGGIPSDEDLQTLVKMGVKTNIDLMGAIPPEKAPVAHEKEAATKAGLKFVSIPLPMDRAVPQDMVEQFLQLVQDPANQPVYVHCRHGRDRTGTMVSAYRITFDGITGEQALEEMKSFGFKPSKYPYFAKFVLDFKGLPVLR